ncbi:hypothetical protein F5B22DRAFT_486909 [Xylaria bambusicola]|uniref:uncharacterized protein n=1 Tax=Xylaria bambusicola TaxID=326684 RepID=UPI00200723B6|nr:uncharacterized protein F5B22DRAFT_486909 [Xylaria bambusicola]KAI0506027.1 hypothetical protein F5B22DRAFT_486909 [Xylaria bambusicola]
MMKLPALWRIRGLPPLMISLPRRWLLTLYPWGTWQLVAPWARAGHAWRADGSTVFVPYSILPTYYLLPCMYLH